MYSHAAARLGWAACGFGLVIWALHFVVWAAGGFPSGLGSTDPEGDWNDSFLRVAYAVTMGTASIIGAAVIARQPRNAIGWISLIAGLMIALDVASGAYATSPALATPGSRPPAASWVAWVGTLFEANWALIVPLLLLFPDGHLPSHRWGPLLWLTAVAGTLLLLTLAFGPGPLSAAAAIDNPLGVPALAEPLSLVGRIAALVLVGAVLLSTAALVLRFRRARGDERQQLKWIVSAAVVWSLALAATLLAPRPWQPVVELAYVLVLGGFVLSFGLAILKYRLYDVDLVISRALVYAVLAASIGLVYIAVVVGMGALIGTRGEPNLVLSLVATATVALAFQPVRERLQLLANRLVYGQRASPYAVLAGFSRRIGSALSVDEVLPRLAEATTQGVGARRSRVRVYVPGGVDRAVAWPPEAMHADFERTAPVIHQGEPVGEIAVSKQPGEALTPAERALLDDLATQAGPAFSNVRLTEQLRASRQRIVAAQDAERRHIERDLHDGAQQHLVALSINLKMLEELIETDTGAAGELLREIQHQATDALVTLRDLARGIYPPALADRGIVAALEGHLAKSRQAASLEVQPRFATARFAPEVEAAVYFCVLEALQNCAKHAREATVRVSLTSHSDRLSFAVIDDGAGFDSTRGGAGSGLHGMADRVAAVGGNLHIRSAPGEGTRVEGTLPLRALVR